MKWLIKKIVGTKNDRDLKKLNPLVDRINILEEEYQQLTEEQLKAKTPEFQQRLKDGETVDDIMCEAFAVVKNACRRLQGTTHRVSDHDLVWDMIPYDVQLVGGIVLHQGRIAEMQTGEGKTLVATMPVYLNALTGKNVHVVTVNDFLADRDSTWMGAIYTYLGLTVGCIKNAMMPSEKREQYACDITYGTNSEFGFDYLRDMGMASHPDEMVQRDYYYAIIDEIDSILIDEARTPLIISGPAPHATNQYAELKSTVERLVRRQEALCNKLMKKAKKHLATEDEEERAQLLLYQVSQGMPKNKDLLKLFEDPMVRKLFEKIDNAMLTDMRKEQARALREELYFTIDEKGHDANLTDQGCEALSPGNPDAFVVPDLISALSELDGQTDLSDEKRFEMQQKIQDEFAQKSERIHNVDQLIRAYCVYEKDVQYVVQNNQVIIVDEFTGRLMAGRRWSDGLHQAVEAKEGVKIERETQTLATITIQNYFRMYDKLAGMTGTAETEANEFHDIYGLDVMVIPTNRPVRRVDYNDCIYKTQREKFTAIMDEIEECHKEGQPVLVGTVSVESSEHLSRMLRKRNIQHNVLNAKNHQREAEIVTRAGQPGAVTIATNMAGRGTDIKLGKGVVPIEKKIIHSQLALADKMESGQTLKDFLIEKPCGLHVIGSERHESRRIDRQLRGRCARQGDPGSSRFYVSLEDDLMRLFGSDKIAGIMGRLGLEEGQVLEHPLLNRSIGTAQRRVEQQNFSIRKRTLEYDDVMNKQREIIYGLRSEVVSSENVRTQLYHLVDDIIDLNVEPLGENPTDEMLQELASWVNMTFPVGLRWTDFSEIRKNLEDIANLISDRVRAAYEIKAGMEDAEHLKDLERHMILQACDTHWQEYLRGIDALRQGVGLRAYGQRDPLVEYKKEAFDLFSDLIDKIKTDVAQKMFRSATSLRAMESFMKTLPAMYVHNEVNAMEQGRQAAASQKRSSIPPSADAAMNAAINRSTTVKRTTQKVGRNDPCPCGSGKKFKKCCGQI